MTRRTLCMLGAVMALLAPMLPTARSKPVARVGMLHDTWRADPDVEAMFMRLAQLGWVEGHNLGVEYHVVATDQKGLAPIIKAMVRLKCDLIVTTATPLALAVKAAAPSIPMVFLIGGDPVTLGLVNSLARPGGHATGLTTLAHESSIKMLGLLREVVPSARRVVVMYQAANPSMLQMFDAIQLAARRVGIVLRSFELRDSQDVDVAYPTLLREPADGLIVLSDRITGANSWNIIRIANHLRLPAVYGSRYFVNVGGLMSYGIDGPVQLTRTADYVARILDGEKPATIPVEQPTRFELVVNEGVAKLQGIRLPQSVLLQATELIR